MEIRYWPWAKSEKKKTTPQKTALGKYGGKGKGNASFKALNCPMP